MSGNFEDFRREYTRGGLTAEEMNASPIRQFESWLEQAVNAGLADPTAMSLATIDEQGRPWQRIVLLKDVAEAGFVFYTNFASDKARALSGNPQASLLFPWNELDRQVTIGGVTARISAAESAAYFRSRPRESQIAAWASRQSRPLASRAVLEERVRELQDRFDEEAVPVPDFWGGFRVQPERIEFWQGGAHRLHDRFRYTRRDDETWQLERLQP